MSKRSKLSKNICRGENNYPLRFTQVNSLVVQQNGTCPCEVNALLRPKIPVWYGNKTSNVHAIATFYKRNCNCITEKRTYPCAVNTLLQLKISVWYGNKTSNVNAIATFYKRNCNCITAERNVFVCSKCLVATANFRLVRQ